MIVVNSTELGNVLNSKTTVALGSFDALHKGHLKVIESAIQHAKSNSLKSLIQIFDSTFFKEPINTLRRRLKILEETGADIVVVEQFDQDFQKLTYKEFVSKYLKHRYNAATVFAGKNYRFGYLAEGNSEKLVSECLNSNIEAHIIDCLQIDEIVSSTKIRDFIKNGQVENAIEYMSRPYALEGTVIHGNAIGRTLGFPTANIMIPSGILVPKDGVYLTKVILPYGTFFGITNIGSKPTVNTSERNIETYISDFDANLYGKSIELEFLKRIRDIKHFESLDLLKNQLELDKKEIPKNEQ